MYPSRTLTIAIARPLDVVYPFLAEPRNLARWGSMRAYRKISDHVWETEDETGPVRIQFTPPNAFGILDHKIYRPGETVIVTRARIYANGEGCELCLTLFQPEGMSDAKFASDFEWMRTDLRVLKTYLES
jgi:hypothetical protein